MPPSPEPPVRGIGQAVPENQASRIVQAMALNTLNYAWAVADPRERGELNRHIAYVRKWQPQPPAAGTSHGARPRKGQQALHPAAERLDLLKQMLANSPGLEGVLERTGGPPGTHRGNIGLVSYLKQEADAEQKRMDATQLSRGLNPFARFAGLRSAAFPSVARQHRPSPSRDTAMPQGLRRTTQTTGRSNAK